MECSKQGIEVCQYKVYEMGTFLTAIVSEIATGDAPVINWPVFFLSLLTVSQVFAKLTRPSFFAVFKVAKTKWWLDAQQRNTENYPRKCFGKKKETRVTRAIKSDFEQLGPGLKEEMPVVTREIMPEQ